MVQSVSIFSLKKKPPMYIRARSASATPAIIAGAFKPNARTAASIRHGKLRGSHF